MYMRVCVCSYTCLINFFTHTHTHTHTYIYISLFRSFIHSFFQVPYITLRTLKAEVIVGLPEGLAEKMDGVAKDWRVSGHYAVVQAKL